MRHRSGLVLSGALVVILCLSAPAPAAPPEAELSVAAMKGDGARVSELIAAGADVNEKQGDGSTALHWAAHQEDLEMARLLLEAGGAAAPLSGGADRA